MSTSQQPGSSAPSKYARAALGALLLGLGIGLVFGCRELWASPWYRWFPLAFLAAALLGWQGWLRTREVYEPLVPGPWQAVAVCLGTGLLLLLAAAVLQRPALVLWALPVVVAGLAVARGGWPLLVGCLPALLMLLVIAPPPFELDRRAIQLAERFILAGADRLLTSLGVPHLRDAGGFELAALRTPSSDLLPGLGGMVGVGGVCLALLLGLRRHPVRIVIALAAVALIALPVEMLRLAWGLKQCDALGVNFFHGLRAEVVMVGLWLVVLLFALALDQLPEFMLQLKARGQFFQSPDYWRLLVALPAVACLVGVVGLGVYLWLWEPARARVKILEAAETAFKGGQHARALLFYRSAVRLQAKTEALHQYRMALSLAALGRPEEAVRMLADLAPLDKPGYGPAQTLLAGEMLKFASTPEHFLTVEAHLNLALEADPQNLEARAALGRLHVRLGRWERACKELKEAVAKYPDLALGLAVAEQGRGDEFASRAWAERAQKFFSAKLEKAAQDDPEARIGQAKALGVIGEFESALALIQAGSKKRPSPLYSTGLAEICTHWAATLEKKKPKAIADRLRVIQIGLAAEPANTYLLQALGRLTALTGADGNAARKVVTEMLSTGTNAPALHFSLGVLAWQNKDLEQARIHLEAAYAAAPQLPNIGNNLATLLLSGVKPDPARALAIIEPLLARFPENPYYRDTRGQALLALGKPREAMLDLEFALTKLPDTAPTHRALADVYRQLGMADLAAAHTRLADTNASPAKVIFQGR